MVEKSKSPKTFSRPDGTAQEEYPEIDLDKAQLQLDHMKSTIPSFAEFLDSFDKKEALKPVKPPMPGEVSGSGTKKK